MWNQRLSYPWRSYKLARSRSPCTRESWRVSVLAVKRSLPRYFPQLLLCRPRRFSFPVWARKPIVTLARKLQHQPWFLFIIRHFIFESHPKNLLAVPYFCLRCLLKPAAVISFSQLHLWRNSCSRRSLDPINLHFLAVYTRWLIKKATNCEKTFYNYTPDEVYRKTCHKIAGCSKSHPVISPVESLRRHYWRH